MLGSLTLLPNFSSIPVYTSIFQNSVDPDQLASQKPADLMPHYFKKTRYIWGQHVKVYLQLFFQDFATLENEAVKQYGPVSA